MEEIHQTHLSNILSFLHRKSTADGFTTLKNAIQIQIHRCKPKNQADDRKKVAIRCTHCFTYWKEGKFSVKYKPKYKSGKIISKRMILKCLVCHHTEYQPYKHRTTTDFRIKKSKSESTTKKNITTLKSNTKQQIKKFTTSKIANKTKNIANKRSKNKSKQKVRQKVIR